MPRRPAVHALPPEVKAWLDEALAGKGFQGYRLLEEELLRRGWEISKSSLQRYGKSFEERLKALKLASEQAKAIVEAAPDEEGAVNEALTRLVQEKLFTVLQDIQVDPEHLNLAGLTRSVAELCRSSVAQKRWRAEALERARREAEAKLERSVAEAGEAARRERLSPVEVLERVKAVYRGEA